MYEEGCDDVSFTTASMRENGTKVLVPPRRLKSMLMNNTLITLENTSRHHELNSSRGKQME